MPLGDQGPYRVSLFWSEPAAGRRDGGCGVVLDASPGGRRPGLHAPDGSPARRAGDQALARSDSSSPHPTGSPSSGPTGSRARSPSSSPRWTAAPAGTGSASRSLLISHELALRTAERSLRWNARRGDPARKERAERDLEVIQSTRKAVIESLRAAALEDEIDAAQSYLGASSGNARSTAPVTVPEPVSPDRLRDLGQPSYLMGFSAGLNEQPTTIDGSFETPDRSETEIPDRARSMLMLGILIAMGLAAITRSRAEARILLLLAAALGLLAFIGGPLVLAVGLILAVAGWSSRPRSSPPRSGEPLPARVVTSG